ncbi:hypothetical protein BU26DRAFT_67073 [Trematosphaeria pertusa]|uniref:Uncharacterized protein n=1 Tax=Trematosphaeria pertusa TaxID=390896 RepID=A0A6A6I495_9PLEO|nr:uncharacterized protein BU26DRAFT_67073 [Trematosphaeria pertusa]KAF2245334.1 hypothetical protein BU26DRAFT_67073 [Trematosphaeria pertusa]
MPCNLSVNIVFPPDIYLAPKKPLPDRSTPTIGPQPITQRLGEHGCVSPAIDGSTPPSQNGSLRVRVYCKGVGPKAGLSALRKVRLRIEPCYPHCDRWFDEELLEAACWREGLVRRCWGSRSRSSGTDNTGVSSETPAIARDLTCATELGCRDRRIRWGL